MCRFLHFSTIILFMFSPGYMHEASAPEVYSCSLFSGTMSPHAKLKQSSVSYRLPTPEFAQLQRKTGQSYAMCTT